MNKTNEKHSATDRSPLLNRAQVAELLGVSHRTIRQWTDDGRLPCVRLGRAVRYRPEDVAYVRAEGLA